MVPPLETVIEPPASIVVPLASAPTPETTSKPPSWTSPAARRAVSVDIQMSAAADSGVDCHAVGIDDLLRRQARDCRVGRRAAIQQLQATAGDRAAAVGAAGEDLLRAAVENLGATGWPPSVTDWLAPSDRMAPTAIPDTTCRDEPPLTVVPLAIPAEADDFGAARADSAAALEAARQYRQSAGRADRLAEPAAGDQRRTAASIVLPLSVPSASTTS